jgi:cupin fold WbuC family metalloprotein
MRYGPPASPRIRLVTEPGPALSKPRRGAVEGFGSLPRVGDEQINDMIRQARSSERRRAIYNYHHPTERLQRMLNAGMRDTYVAPHVHDHPRKLELFVILRGSVAVVAFDKDGNVADCVVLSDKGPLRIAEIPAGTWHSFVVLTPSAVVYELVDGRYDPRTHKHFAPWAPEESDTRSALAFLKKLRRQIDLAAETH